MRGAGRLLRGIPILVLAAFLFSLGRLFFPLPSIPLFDPEVLHIFEITLGYSALALVCSWCLSHLFLRAKSELLFSVFRFFWVMPGFAYALIVLLSSRVMGIQDRYSMRSVFAAWVLAGVPFLTLAIREALQDLDPREKEALQSLGANPRQVWFHFDWIRTLPAQSAALLQQFWLYLTSFSLVMILSGGPPNETLEVAIYTSVRLDQVNLGRALALCLWQAVLLIVLRFSLQTKTHTGLEWGAEKKVVKRSFVKRSFLGIGLIGLIFLFQSRDLNLDGFGGSLFTGIGLALLVMALTLSFSLLCYFTRVAWIAEFGAWFSPMVLTLAWWKLCAFSLPPLLNCLLIQVVLFSPWIARTLFPMLDRKRNLELEAARSLGASPIRAWFAVEWPRLKGAFSFCLSLLFFLSINEVTAVLLFSKGEFEPLSVWVQNSFFRFRIEEAALGTMVLILISYFVMDRGSKTT